MFYGRLFEIDPTLRSLFANVDMPLQRAKLTTFLGGAVSNLDRLEALLPSIASLGRRHVAYGVTDRHYDVVGAALLWTLEKGLGDAWNAEAKEAWSTVYGAISGAMRGGAESAAP